MRLLAILALCAITACAPSTRDGGVAPTAVRSTAATADLPTGAPPARQRVVVAYAENTPAQATSWTSYEAGIFAKHGLDVELNYVASAQSTSAVLAGDVNVSLSGGGATMNSRLGGSDVLIFLGITNWYPYDLMVTPDIQTADDLRGKIVGISRFGSSSDVATRIALQYLGLVPDRDVTFVQMGSIQERIAGMRAGAIAGGLASPPQNTALRKQGFRSLIDLSTTGEPAMNNVAAALAPWLRGNEATAQAFTNAMLEGVAFAKSNPEYAQRVLAQYMRLDDLDAAAEAYDHYVVRNLPRVLYPNLDAARKYLDETAAADPRAANARLEDFFDLRFLDRAVASGLIDRLYGSQ